MMCYLGSLPLKFLTMLHGDAEIQPGGLEAFSLLCLFIVFAAILEDCYVKVCILQTKNTFFRTGPQELRLNLF